VGSGEWSVGVGRDMGEVGFSGWVVRWSVESGVDFGSCNCRQYV